MSFSPALCRAARALLDLDVAGLVKKSGVPKTIIADFEKGKPIPQQQDIPALRLALEEAGVTFLDDEGNGPGLRLSTGSHQTGMRPEQLSAENDG